MNVTSPFSWRLYDETPLSSRIEIDKLIADITKLWGDPLDWLPIDVSPQPSARQLYTQGFKPQNYSITYLRKLHHLAQTSQGQLDLVHSCIFSVVNDRYESDGPFSDISKYPHLMAEDMDEVERQVERALEKTSEESEENLASATDDRPDEVPAENSAGTSPQLHQQHQPQARGGAAKASTQDQDKDKRSSLEEKQRVIAAIEKDWPSGDWIPEDLLPRRKGKLEMAKDPLEWGIRLLKILRSLSTRTRQDLALAQEYMTKIVKEKHSGRLVPISPADLGKASDIAQGLKKLVDEKKQREAQRAKKNISLQQSQAGGPGKKPASTVATSVPPNMTAAGRTDARSDSIQPSTAMDTVNCLPKVVSSDHPFDRGAATGANAASTSGQPRVNQQSGFLVDNTVQVASGSEVEYHTPLPEKDSGLFVPEKLSSMQIPDETATSADPEITKSPGYADFVASRLTSRNSSLGNGRPINDVPRPRLFKELIRISSDEEDGSEDTFEFMVADRIGNAENQDGDDVTGIKIEQPVQQPPSPGAAPTGRLTPGAGAAKIRRRNAVERPAAATIDGGTQGPRLEEPVSEAQCNRMALEHDKQPEVPSHGLEDTCPSDSIRRQPRSETLKRNMDMIEVPQQLIPAKRTRNDTSTTSVGRSLLFGSAIPQPRPLPTGFRRSTGNTCESLSRGVSYDDFEIQVHRGLSPRVTRNAGLSTSRSGGSLPDCECHPFETSDDDHYCAVADRNQRERIDLEETMMDKDLEIQELKARVARLESQLRKPGRMNTESRRFSGRF